ncbi:hypothetical protein EW026_g5162 [Hermanssonia centrifuga]|uniref:Retrovirus-related Pol polyprotein from transposon TNT 1-94-like beta-barrel domain-containing protein n=1 Tax=Hermanssonia centrifuga TaxID=98765 RepID=A0A4S4KEW7_9APHY|nr:hypothetical protein EW026_g5162 [Hermanssonia centrifuga]
MLSSKTKFDFSLQLMLEVTLITLMEQTPFQFPPAAPNPLPSSPSPDAAALTAHAEEEKKYKEDLAKHEKEVVTWKRVQRRTPCGPRWDVRCGDREDLSVHFTKLRTMRENLAAMGHPPSNDNFYAIILGSLPSSYKPYISAVTATSSVLGTTLSPNDLMLTLTEEYERRTLRAKGTQKEDGGEAAFFTSDKGKGSSRPDVSSIPDSEEGSIEDGKEATYTLTFEGAFLAKENALGRELETELYDSDATQHMSPYRHHFINFEAIPPKPIGVADNCTFQAVGKGNIFTDDNSRWTQIYLIRTKDKVFSHYKGFSAWMKTQHTAVVKTQHTTVVKTQHTAVVKTLHSGRGGEYLSTEFSTFLAEQAERLNRTLVTKIRAMLIDSGLPKFLWGEAAMHACYLKNRTSTRALEGTTPHEAFLGGKPDISNLHPWDRDEIPPAGRGKQIRKPSDYVRRLREDEGATLVEEVAVEERAMAAVIGDAEGLEPTLEEVRKRPDWPKWLTAIKSKLKSLNSNETWTLVEQLSGVNVIGSKWVLRIKKNAVGEIDKYKACLVTQGYS